MPKFFLKDEQASQSYKEGDFIILQNEDAHHISKTLRMKVGDSLTVTDLSGLDYACIIDSFDLSSVCLKVENVTPNDVEPTVKVTLFQALIKGDKIETVIQKAVELGVDQIYAVEAERSVVRLDEKSKIKKLERWNKIALEASKQSGRGKMIEVKGIIPFDKCVKKISEMEVGFFCYEKSENLALKELLNKKASSIGFYIGPEGGISPDELSLIEKKNIPSVSLGKLILRTETAGPAVLAMILYETRL